MLEKKNLATGGFVPRKTRAVPRETSAAGGGRAFYGLAEGECLSCKMEKAAVFILHNKSEKDHATEPFTGYLHSYMPTASGGVILTALFDTNQYLAGIPFPVETVKDIHSKMLSVIPDADDGGVE